MWNFRTGRSATGGTVSIQGRFANDLFDLPDDTRLRPYLVRGLDDLPYLIVRECGVERPECTGLQQVEPHLEVNPTVFVDFGTRRSRLATGGEYQACCR